MQKSIHCQIQLQVSASLALPRREHQCIGGALDPAIATSTQVALLRLSNDDQERISASCSDRKLLAYGRQIGRAIGR
jgi:hypothetical protein